MSELPVVAEVRPLEPVRPAPVPAATVPQTAAVAATSFLAGAMALALARRRSARRLARRRGGLPIVGSRSFLVDIHLLER